MNNESLLLAIDAYRKALPPGRLLEFSLTPLDRLGIPVRALTLFPSVAADGPTMVWPLCEGIGYGWTEDEARVGAYGELTEEASSSLALTRLERIVGSYRELLGLHGERGVVDPITLCLEAGTNYTPDTVLEWAVVHRWATHERVLLPVEFVACAGMDAPPRPGITRLITPITNGHGAGSSLEMAQTHGLLELLQRDGNSVQYRALARAVAVDLATIKDPFARTLLDRYDQAGIEMIVKVAATDFGFVNLYAVGYDRDSSLGGLPVMTAACGEAVHPVPEVALRKALLEFASSRARLALFHGPLDIVRRVAPEDYLERYNAILDPAEEEPRGLSEMQRWIKFSLAEMRDVLAPVFAVSEKISFAALAPADRISTQKPDIDKRALLSEIVEKLLQAGMDVLTADLSIPSSGVYAVKMIVPGLEVETMSYHRIGERNFARLRARTEEDGKLSGLAGLGAPPDGAARVFVRPEVKERLGADPWVDTRALDDLMRDLYVLYREPSRHVTMLSLPTLSPDRTI